ncbi:MAG TPA: NAD(P)-dependent oxidoreductase [Bryobacteraceae bacterium]
MKIFVAGATGAVGKQLVPLLISKGHHVVATTRTAGKTEALRALGAEAIELDGLNRNAVIDAVVASRPEAIVHQMTALASMRSLKNFDEEFAVTNRLRTEGTEHLIAAAQAAGTRKLVVQSYTGWPNARTGGPVKTEDDPLDTTPPKKMSRSLVAMRELERLVASANGVQGTVLRYGNFYGPGTSFSPDGEITRMVRRRQFPIIGSGAGIWSFIHMADTASAALAAIESNASGVFNIVDDEPAAVSVWLPELAKTIGAKPPRRIPAWLGRLVMGESGVSMMTQVRGSSNAKAKRVLGWQPIYRSWRQGFLDSK